MSLDPESTASAKTKSPDSFEHPTSMTPSAVASLLSVQPACFPVSDLVGGITSGAHHVLDAHARHWFASGCPLGTFPHLLWTCVAGGHAEILARASTLAIRPSFDSLESSGASVNHESTARAPATLTSSFEHPPAPAPSTTISFPSDPAVHPSVSDLFGGVVGPFLSGYCQ